MARPRYDRDGEPIFEIPYISLPDALPYGLNPNLVPKFRYMLRLYLLLEELWTVQLGTIYMRNSRNIRRAHTFWCEYGPRTWAGNRFGFTETWITDAMLKTKHELINLVRSSRLCNIFDARGYEAVANTPGQSLSQVDGSGQESSLEPDSKGKAKQKQIEGATLSEESPIWDDQLDPSPGEEEASAQVSSMGSGLGSVSSIALGSPLLEGQPSESPEDLASASTSQWQERSIHSQIAEQEDPVPSRIAELVKKMDDADPDLAKRERAQFKRAKKRKREENPTFGSGPSSDRNIIEDISDLAGEPPLKLRPIRKGQPPVPTPLRRSQRIQEREEAPSGPPNRPEEGPTDTPGVGRSRGVRRKPGRIFNPK
ncbi:hypothetical protein PRK78_006504 [Emydomyces testavorans]|uniref:Uncharacterized protein n=1 Tax=Emydomyces testavorans TaxID=2070801 RepID=A0AAF0IKJ3_9EURO|nr:hypothetical protein PRK78_006504 [Emydomyces testavorans]